MDKKEKMIQWKCLAALLVFFSIAFQLRAQDVNRIEFCDRSYKYGVGNDSITLYIKITDSDGNRSKDVTVEDLNRYLVIYEDGDDNGDIISTDRRTIHSVTSGRRIPPDYTISVLVDLNIPTEGKEQIFNAIWNLVDGCADSTVYLSFFGDKVTPSVLVNKRNYKQQHEAFLTPVSAKYFYNAMYTKLAEFSGGGNAMIAKRARAHSDKNFLFVFTEGMRQPDFNDTQDFLSVTGYQIDTGHLVPKVFGFYYTGQGLDEGIKTTLEGLANPNVGGVPVPGRKGGYKPSDDLNTVLADFEQVVQDAMYDFAFEYRATDGKIYMGKTMYKAEWKNELKGEGEFSIGSAENPWPAIDESAGNSAIKYLVAILVTILTVAFFFFVMKVVIPFLKSKAFALKYYKKYVPEPNVTHRVCHYCKQEILPGQKVVVKCEHIMHVHCWKQNGYKCAEYGQNCKTGIQEYVDWHDLFTKTSLRDCHQMISGILAGLFSWIIYELMGRGGFAALANAIVKTFITDDVKLKLFYETAAAKVSAFLTIGLLLGFFLSFMFRYNDEYRRKDWRIYLKILVLSLLSGIIGMAAFAVGAIILCLLVSAIGATTIPWYCSFPAYLLFSVCLTLSLTIKSTIPVKSALIGGLVSAVIGFLVLYFSNLANSSYGWMNMLLDFVIYGGGLGASLVTVRMLAEKYFLVIQNGVKAGQRIPIHKWMNATGGGNKVSIGMTGDCEIQMNWEKSNKVAKEHAQLYIDQTRQLPVIKPLATGVIYNTHAELPVGKSAVLSNGDTFKIGDTTYQYIETD